MKHPDPTTLETQVGKKGKPFRHSGTSKDTTKPENWIGGEIKYCWIYTFKYLDGSGSFQMYEDYFGNRKIVKR